MALDFSGRFRGWRAVRRIHLELRLLRDTLFAQLGAIPQGQDPACPEVNVIPSVLGSQRRSKSRCSPTMRRQHGRFHMRNLDADYPAFQMLKRTIYTIVMRCRVRLLQSSFLVQNFP